MKTYNIIYLLLIIGLLASCAEDDLPEPEVKTVALTGTVTPIGEFGDTLMGLDLSDANITLIRQTFNSIVGGLAVNSDGTYSLADLPIREYGVIVERPGFNQVLEDNDLRVNSSANTEQRLVVDIPENADGTDYEVDLYIREASSTKVATASFMRGAVGTQGTTTNITGTIDNGTVPMGYKRGVYAYFAVGTPTNEDFLYRSEVIPVSSGGTNFSFSITDFALLNAGFSSGNRVSVAFYGLTLDASNNVVTIANSEALVQSDVFTLP